MLKAVSYQELHRPQFHFTARENWINDPNGLVYHDGFWHLFFQHNTEATTWGNMTWGHAQSRDLLNWQQIDHALHPDALGTMFSGSAVSDLYNRSGFGKESLLAFYTAAGQFVNPKRPYTQCLAFSLNNGKTWEKYHQNPILDEIEPGNRDPKVVWHEKTNKWIMALYLSEDRYCLLSSQDTKNWTHFQDLNLEGDSECPDFFSISNDLGEEKWVFSGASGHYLIGQFDGTHFTPEIPQQCFEHGQNGYASQTWSNAPNNRRVQISWMAGGLYPEMPFNQQMSIPVELTLKGTHEDMHLSRFPISEITSLYENTTTIQEAIVSQDQSFNIQSDNACFDLSFDLPRSNAKTLYIIIRGQTLTVDWMTNEIKFEGARKSKVVPERNRIPLPLKESISIRLLVDKASIELFLDDGEISASFCYLPDAHIDPVVFHCYQGHQPIRNLNLHKMKSIWIDQALA